MMRVVDILPGKAEIAATGLAERNFIVDRDAYRHFVERYRREFVDFKRSFYGNGGTADGATDPGCNGRTLTALDEACIEAFERSRPPFYYHLGSLYRYRIDRPGTNDRPILLERAERSEVSGSVAGIPVFSEHRGLLIRFCLWMERKFQKREQRGKS
ncbi:MAG: hypothetical protein JXL20_10020 [Deltaproteobacteria bacterium]|nr:hypothetical protein [Deltaproteobacteria bacterium]